MKNFSGPVSKKTYKSCYGVSVIAFSLSWRYSNGMFYIIQVALFIILDGVLLPPV
jgi:hypothetical protein